MIPDPVVLQQPPAAVVVRVPEVATTASDGLPRTLHAGRFTVRLPVWAAPNATARTARLTAGAVSCPPVALRPGAVVQVGCTFAVHAGASVTVTLSADGGPVARWRHSAR